MASGRVDAGYQSSKPSQSPILGRACPPLTPPEAAQPVGRRLLNPHPFNFCHTSLLIFNISHYGPSPKNMKILISQQAFRCFLWKVYPGRIRRIAENVGSTIGM